MHTTGHLFEKRYHPILVVADEYLLELLRYIHLNPVRAHMVQSADEYRWSSHHVYLGERPEPWVTTDFALSMFHSDRHTAIDAYRRFVSNGHGSGRSPLADCNANDARVLGSDEFAGRLPGAVWTPRSRKTLEQLITETHEQFGVTAAQLCSASREQRLVKARAWIAQQAVIGRIASIALVARTLNRDESSLRRALKKHFNHP